MKRCIRFLSIVPAFALLCAASSGFAATVDDEWQALIQSMGSSSPPAMASDCTKYTTDSAKTECMDFVNKKPTFTYRAAGNQQVGADKAAILYCSRLGKTYKSTGPSPSDPMLMTYQCN